MSTHRAKRATDEVLASRERVIAQAKAISQSLSNRELRARTNPFIRLDEHSDESSNEEDDDKESDTDVDVFDCEKR